MKYRIWGKQSPTPWLIYQWTPYQLFVKYARLKLPKTDKQRGFDSSLFTKAYTLNLHIARRLWLCPWFLCIAKGPLLFLDVNNSALGSDYLPDCRLLMQPIVSEAIKVGLVSRTGLWSVHDWQPRIKNDCLKRCGKAIQLTGTLAQLSLRDMPLA